MILLFNPKLIFIHKSLLSFSSPISLFKRFSGRTPSPRIPLGNTFKPKSIGEFSHNLKLASQPKKFLLAKDYTRTNLEQNKPPMQKMSITEDIPVINTSQHTWNTNVFTKIKKYF